MQHSSRSKLLDVDERHLLLILCRVKIYFSLNDRAYLYFGVGASVSCFDRSVPVHVAPSQLLLQTCTGCSSVEWSLCGRPRPVINSAKRSGRGACPRWVVTCWGTEVCLTPPTPDPLSRPPQQQVNQTFIHKSVSGNRHANVAYSKKNNLFINYTEVQDLKGGGYKCCCRKQTCMYEGCVIEERGLKMGLKEDNTLKI